MTHVAKHFSARIVLISEPYSATLQGLCFIRSSGLMTTVVTASLVRFGPLVELAQKKVLVPQGQR